MSASTFLLAVNLSFSSSLMVRSAIGERAFPARQQLVCPELWRVDPSAISRPGTLSWVIGPTHKSSHLVPLLLNFSAGNFSIHIAAREMSQQQRELLWACNAIRVSLDEGSQG